MQATPRVWLNQSPFILQDGCVQLLGCCLQKVGHNHCPPSKKCRNRFVNHVHKAIWQHFAQGMQQQFTSMQTRNALQGFDDFGQYGWSPPLQWMGLSINSWKEWSTDHELLITRPHKLLTKVVWSPLQRTPIEIFARSFVIDCAWREQVCASANRWRARKRFHFWRTYRKLRCIL